MLSLRMNRDILVIQDSLTWFFRREVFWALIVAACLQSVRLFPPLFCLALPWSLSLFALCAWLPRLLASRCTCELSAWCSMPLCGSTVHSSQRRCSMSALTKITRMWAQRQLSPCSINWPWMWQKHYKNIIHNYCLQNELVTLLGFISFLEH